MPRHNHARSAAFGRPMLAPTRRFGQQIENANKAGKDSALCTLRFYISCVPFTVTFLFYGRFVRECAHWGDCRRHSSRPAGG